LFWFKAPASLPTCAIEEERDVFALALTRQKGGWWMRRSLLHLGSASNHLFDKVPE